MYSKLNSNKNKNDLTGQKFGRWTVIEKVGKRKNGTNLWRCICECNNESSVSTSDLRAGGSLSCGCWQLERSSTHGLSYNKLYHVWHDMHHRCYKEINKHFKDYGGRGIIVCERWHSIELFIKDLEESYLEHKNNNKTTQLDRIDNSGNYEPSNCRWVTSMINNSNTRKMQEFVATSPTGEIIEHNNKSAFSREYNLDPSSITKCLKGMYKHHKGWTFKLKG